MQMPRTWIVFICLSGIISSGQNLDSRHDTDALMEISTDTPELLIAPIPSPRIDAGVTLLDAHAAESEDEHLQANAEKETEQEKTDFTNLEAGRRRRSAWGTRKHAATVESIAYRIAGLGRPINGWRKRGKGEDVSSALLAALRVLHAEKRRLMDLSKAREEEEDDDDDEDEDDDDDDDDEDEDDEDDDDEDEEEEEEEEEQEEEEEAEEEEKEEEEEEETTESPSNQTETLTSFTESPIKCQSTEREITCRGIGMIHLPSFHNLEATKLDLAENNIRIITAQAFSGLLNLDTLDLSQNVLDDESFSQNPLSNLTFLKKLNLDGNQITMIPVLPPSLEELKVKNNRLSTLTPHCFKGLMSLLKLELEGNTLHEGSVSPLAFRPLQRLLDLHLNNNSFRSLPLNLPPSLQTLKMNENLIKEVTEEALRNCIHLRVLELSRNHLHEQGIATHAWTRLKSLEVLDLSHNLFTSIPLNLPRALRKLTLQHNSISHIRAFTFRHLRPGLQSLCLSHNALSNEGIEQFSFVGTYRSLDELLLDNNRLGEVPRCVRQFKNLQVLRLNNNQIRLVRRWGVCHPHNSGSLASVHLENNHLEVEKIPPNAFSCLTDPQGLVLYPQQWSAYD